MEAERQQQQQQVWVIAFFSRFTHRKDDDFFIGLSRALLAKKFFIVGFLVANC